MENKMQWLIDRYNEGKCEYLISKIPDTIGSIIMPTGHGKSGVSFEDAIWHIDNRNHGKKLVLNFAAPILKLNRQSLNDFLSVLSETHKNLINEGKIMFFINSSDTDEQYNAIDSGIDVFRFDEIDKFYRSKKAEIAIIASCHKSLDKFVAKMPTMRKYGVLVTYLDEAHLINTTKMSYARCGVHYEENPSFIKLCENSDFLYAMTATPDRAVTERINKYNFHTLENGEGDATYFSYKIDAREDIENNIILPPRVEVMHMKEDEVINPNLLIKHKNHLKKVHPNINTKILVTCKNSQELSALADGLIKKGEKVFSTCAKEGCKHTAEGEFAEEIDEITFMEEVNNYDNDCFVLHIKQLIQGIDIKSITSAVICTASHTSSETNKKHIQIIGRTLRPANGERGVAIENREKKYGDVLFIMPIGFEKEKYIISFIEKYYGIGCIVGDYKDSPVPHHSLSEEDIMDMDNYTISFEEDEKQRDSSLLLINIEDYIKTNLVKKNEFILKNKGKGIDIENELNLIIKNCGSFSEDYDSVVLLSRTNLQLAIKELFKKYDIVQTI